MSTYVISEKTQQQIDEAYEHGGEVTQDQRDRAYMICEKARDLALLIAGESKPGREQALALTNLENSMMWACMAIAREP